MRNKDRFAAGDVMEVRGESDDAPIPWLFGSNRGSKGLIPSLSNSPTHSHTLSHTISHTLSHTLSHTRRSYPLALRVESRQQGSDPLLNNGNPPTPAPSTLNPQPSNLNLAP